MASGPPCWEACSSPSSTWRWRRSSASRRRPRSRGGRATDPLAPARSLVLAGHDALGRPRFSDLLAGPVGLAPLVAVPASPLHRGRAALVASLGDRPARRRELAAWIADALRAALLRERTYAELGAEREARLLALCRALVDETVGVLAEPTSWESAGKALEARLAALQEELRALVAGSVGDPAEAGSEVARDVPPAPCHAYSADLQLAVLGLDAEALVPPVLDLGCGAEGRLVRHLHARGIAALGVDREAPAETGFLRVSWLELPLAAGLFGTVVSHQAFSLHFLHAHLRDAEAAARYARRYREILETLRPGGAFHYAPGLPFVERHLDPDRFALRTRPIALPEAVREEARRLEEVLGGPIQAATVVRRPGGPGR